MSRRLAKRVLLVGWDAADWMMIRPLLADGKMPALARLISSGVSGNLATIQPALSPMLWNSIATGKRADKHGVCSFVEPMPDGSGIRPVTSGSRRCKAIWNICSQVGLKSNVVSWFASHPAEPIAGTVVSDRYVAAISSSSELPRFSAGTFHPPTIEAELASLLVSPSDLDAEALLPFVPLAAEVDQDSDDRLVKLAVILAKSSSVHAAACRLAGSAGWDFMAVYYSMLDEFGHHFMPYHPPRMPGVEPRDAALYSEVMTSAYRFQDMMLESLLARAGSETTVILVSDHGFHLGDRRPSANGWDSPQEWHREFGIACAAGPGVRSDQTLYGASLLDVTPTILALLGLPVGEDMDGRAWLEILDPSPRLERIESWEQVPDTSPTSLPAAAVDPTAEAEMIRQLVNLGYLDPPSADAQQSVRDAIRDAKVNLAVAVTSSRRAAEALHLWKELIRDHPDEEGFRLQLAHCYMRLGKWPECFEEIELLSQELRESGLVKLMLATVAAGEGRLENALDQARNLARLPMHDPGLVNRLGSLFIQLRAWTEADTEFRRSLELMPDNPVARDGLSQICFHRHEFDVAAEHALEAVGLMHFFPGAHFHLAEALSASGRDREAILAFEASLSMGYEPAATHRRLADMYRIRDPAKSLFHHGLAADAGAWTLTADEC